ncbi:hypothetical protein PRZ48_008802 [Zasmidium cellare]|uniref:Uncharacterized protein n=1 Tax=Zasmidium cellare TaxID=395010 RepID=A0ABR0EHD5_ZASCE|nr:hypothetical protein PRZ48_008802 [Zasmidium cellare]
MPSGLQMMIPPKRPVRINGRLSLPAELWVDVITKAVTNDHGMIICGSRFPQLPGVQAQDLRTVVADLLRPFDQIPVAKHQAERDVWTVNEIVFSMNSQNTYGRMTWTRVVGELQLQIRKLHFLIHDHDKQGWALPWLASELGQATPPIAPVHNMSYPLHDAMEVALQCPRLESATFQILHIPSRRNRSSKPEYRTSIMTRKLKSTAHFFQRLLEKKGMEPNLANLGRMVLAVTPREDINGCASLALGDSQVTEVVDGDMLRMDPSALRNRSIRDIYTPSGESITSRVALQLTFAEQ